MDGDVDNLESESDREGGTLLLSDEEGESSDPEVSVVTKGRDADGKKKSSNLFSWFPVPKWMESSARHSSDTQGHQNYRVYKWRWFMLVTMFLLNVSNGTVRKRCVSDSDML